MKKHVILSATCLLMVTAAVSVNAMPDMAASADSKNSAPATSDLTGKVLQTMNNAGYSYIQIQKKNGEKVWVAVTETTVKVGSQVSFYGGMEMRDFESKGLKRKFDSIMFADGIVTAQGKGGATADKSKEKDNSPGSKGAVSPKDAKISVTKATGSSAYTVQEAFAKSATLNKKKVVIRGKVVKVSSGIMGKNWIHIQDGTGSQATANHNLVCTSTGMAAMGDIVTVSGTLAKDKDFGYGYKYAVIIEDATFKK